MMMEQIVHLLGGRVAEKLTLNDITPEQATILKGPQRLREAWLQNTASAKDWDLSITAPPRGIPRKGFLHQEKLLRRNGFGDR
jgi:hypothetical protein